MDTILRRFLVIALVTSAVQLGNSQTNSKNSSSNSPDARAEDLAKIKEALADPDPLRRLAMLESTINSGDELRIQVALRLAFQSDDSDLRALALRGYIANRKAILFDIQLPPPLQKAYQDALADPDKTTAFFNTHPYARVLSQIGFRVQYAFSKFTAANSTGLIADSTRGVNAETAQFSISGDRLAASVETVALGSCRVDFRPIASVFKGALACNFSYGGGPAPKLDVSAPVF
jgi:hypothetical protein